MNADAYAAKSPCLFVMHDGAELGLGRVAEKQRNKHGLSVAVGGYVRAQRAHACDDGSVDCLDQFMVGEEALLYCGGGLVEVLRCLRELAEAFAREKRREKIKKVDKFHVWVTKMVMWRAYIEAC